MDRQETPEEKEQRKLREAQAAAKFHARQLDKQLRGTARKLVKSTSIPSRPGVMLKVFRAMEGFAPDLQQVADLVQHDVSLTAEILSAANTTVPKKRRTVSAVSRAVMLLGIDRTREMVNSRFLVSPLVGKDNPLQSLRRRCVVAGRVCASLALSLREFSPSFQSGYLPLVAPDEAFALGLLHDVGVLVLAQAHEDYGPFYEKTAPQGGEALLWAERHRFGIHHAAVSDAYCERYVRLPKPYVLAIRHHHEINTFFQPGMSTDNRLPATLQTLLNMTDLVRGDIDEENKAPIESAAMRLFGITSEHLETVVQRAAGELNSESEPEA